MTRRRFGGGHDDERGAASLLAVALIGVLVLLGVAFSFVVANAAAHRTAQSAADLAALAGATAGQRAGHDACAAAADVAVANGARIVDCVVAGADVTVQVAVEGPTLFGHSFEITGRARAGPSA